ncbi:MAG: YlxR family protein [Ruminococcaceae bacterium]|nr:YlxR family protein [Oscillospiraceae bacterium]
MRNPANTRTCAGCGKKQLKNNLLRIGLTENNTVVLGSSSGRGAYICKSDTCLKAALKKKRFNYILRSSVPAEIFDELSNIIGSDQN